MTMGKKDLSGLSRLEGQPEASSKLLGNNSGLNTLANPVQQKVAKTPQDWSWDDLIKETPKITGRGQLLFVFDATGSMQPLWEKTRGILEHLLGNLGELGIKAIKFIAYRDYDLGDKLIEKSEWSNNSQVLHTFLRNIDCIGNSTWDEAVEEGLKQAAEEGDNYQAVILIGDCPPHADNELIGERPNYIHWAKMLGERKRPVYALRVGDYPETEAPFKKIAELTGGTFSDLEKYEDLEAVIQVIGAFMGGKSMLKIFIRNFPTALPPSAEKLARKLLNS